MKRSRLFLFVVLCLLVPASFGQTVSVANGDMNASEVNRIVKKFTENEADFRAALTNYVFNRYATINIIGLGGQIAGTYRRDSFMTFSKDGARFEKILYAPIATTHPGFVSPQDLEDLGGVTPFALEPHAVSQYNFAYMGKERIDELNLYVFDVTPKVIPDPKKSKQRLFMGRIWVDVDDLMIVKSRGKAVPETKTAKFPVVETTREQVDGKYWFPSDARSDDELVFDDGEVIKIRMRVRYADYKVGRTDVRILDEEELVPEATPEPKNP
jgi:hypothetical protein